MTLRGYQKRALDSWDKAGRRGAIVLPTGAGKTEIAMKAMELVNEPAIVIVPTLDLLGQWRGRVEGELGIEVGAFGGGESTVKAVTVCTYDSAYIRAGELGNRFRLLIFDECLTGDTLVTLSDGGVAAISEVRDGNLVLGGTVTNKFSRQTSDLWTLKTGFTTLNCTGTHPHLVVRRRRDRKNNQWFRVASGDAKVVRTEELRRGDLLLVPERIPHTTIKTWSEDQLRFVGLISGDGHIDKRYNSVKVAVARSNKPWVRDVFIKGILGFGHKDFWEFVNARGDYTIGCSSEQIRTALHSFGVPRGKKSGAVDITNEVFYSSKKAILAFLDGIFSSDGWARREENGALRIALSTNSRVFASKIQLLLKKFGIHTTVHEKQARAKRHQSFQVWVGGPDFNALEETLTFSRPDLNTTERNRGKDMNDRLQTEDGDFRLVPVKEIQRDDGRSAEVFDFTAEGTHTFLANGTLTHNCHHLPAESFRQIAEMFTAPYRMGLTATYEREDLLHLELPRLIGGVVYRLEPEDLAGRYLSDYAIERVNVELTEGEKEEYGRNYRVFADYLESNRIWLRSPLDFQRFIMRTGRDPQARRALLARNRAMSIAFNSQAKMERLEEVLRANPDERILIFTQHNELVYRISRRFLLPFITHTTDKEERYEVLKGFREGRFRAIVTSKVLDEGIDVPEASIGVIVSGTGSSREFIQRLGRLLRKSEGKGQARLIELVSRETSETGTSSRRRRGRQVGGAEGAGDGSQGGSGYGDDDGEGDEAVGKTAGS
jgi:superfamily II DNA or RNA helicase